MFSCFLHFSVLLEIKHIKEKARRSHMTTQRMWTFSWMWVCESSAAKVCLNVCYLCRFRKVFIFRPRPFCSSAEPSSPTTWAHPAELSGGGNLVHHLNRLPQHVWGAAARPRPLLHRGLHLMMSWLMEGNRWHQRRRWSHMFGSSLWAASSSDPVLIF